MVSRKCILLVKKHGACLGLNYLGTIVGKEAQIWRLLVLPRWGLCTGSCYTAAGGEGGDIDTGEKLGSDAPSRWLAAVIPRWSNSKCCLSAL